MSAFNWGVRYVGNSIIKGGTFSLCVVLFITITETIATKIPSIYMEKVKSPASTPTAAAIAAAIMAINSAFAPQVKNGITRIVLILSFSVASVRVLIIAGIAQPKPIIIGIKARPETPNLRKIRSNIKAIRAIYPLSSIIEKKV